MKTLQDLIRESSESDSDEAEPSRKESRNSFYLHAISQARRSAEHVFPKAREWAVQFPKGLESRLKSVLRRIGIRVSGVQAGAYQFESLPRGQSATAIIRAVSDGLGLKQGDIETPGSTTVMLASHESGRVWWPVFYHPRGNRFEIDPSGATLSSAASALSSQIFNLRDHQKDDLAQVEFHEWTLGSEIAITLTLVEETPDGMFVTLKGEETPSGPDVNGDLVVGIRSIFPVYIRPTGRVREYLTCVKVYAKESH